MIAYNVFRWYRAGWGRYTQADPMAPGGSGVMLPFDSGPRFKRSTDMDPRAMMLHPESISFFDTNLYSYGARNPLKYTDPFGLWLVLCTVHSVSAKPEFEIQIDKNTKAIHCLYIGDCFPSFGYKITAQAEVDALSPPCKECPKKWFCFASAQNPGDAKNYKLEKKSQVSCY